jgi:hypothetical protein
MQKLDEFTQAYIEAALWASFDDSETPIEENYGVEDFAPEALTAIIGECADFQNDNAEALEIACEQDWYSMARAGHDFWLTRNGHGAGFWDRCNDPVFTDTLSNAACAYGTCDLYVSDDGTLSVT